MNELPLANEVLTIQWAMGVASIAMGLVFAYAAASKLSGLSSFVAGIQDYNLLPSPLAPLAAGLLILLESLIAVAHIAAVALTLVVPGAIALLAVFFITMSALLKRGEKRPCLCFGTNRDDLVDIYSLVRIVLLLAVEVTLLAYLSGGGSISIDTGNVPGSIAAIAIAALSVVLIGWWLTFPKLYHAWRIVRS